MSWATVASVGVGLVSANQSKKAAQGANNSPSVQTNEPWGTAQPYLLQGFEHAGSLLQDWNSPNVRGANDALRARGLSGSAAGNEANNLATSTMRGDYLNSNPFLNDAVKDAMGMAKSQINSQFAGNNYGSSAHQEWLGKGLMNAAMPYMSQNYENERGRQYAAMAQAPALQSMDYQNIEAQQQANMQPWDFLGRYQQTISGMNPGGGTSSMQNPYFSNPVNAGLGGALMGNQLYNAFTQPNQSSGNAWGNWANMGSSTPFTQSGFADL